MKSLLATKRFLLGLSLLVCFTLTATAQIPRRPQPPVLVNDLAGLFTASQVSALEQTLVAFDDSTSNQIAVVTVNDLGDYEPSMFAYEILSQWGVGQTEKNNGLVLLIKPKVGNTQGRVSISVGYGLEPVITDAFCKRVIETALIPAFKANDYYSGVEQAIEMLKAKAVGEFNQADEEDEDDNKALVGFVVFMVICIFLLCLVAGKNNGPTNLGSGKGKKSSVAEAILLGILLNSGGGRSGGFGGGGGFGGFGGGMGGGGGASGSW